MRLKKWTAAFLAAVMVLTFTACGSGKGGEDPAVARIGEAEITQSKLDKFVALSAYAAGQDISSLESQPDYLQYLKKMMLQNMVSYEAMRLSLEEEGKEIFPEDYKGKLDEFVKGAKANTGDFLKKNNIDDDMLNYYFNLSYYSAPYREKAEAMVTDKEVKDFYEKNKANFVLKESQGEVSHIVVADEKLANEIYDKLKDGGDFAKLAKEYGTDGTKDTGGSLGVLSENEYGYDADFMKGAFTLKSGEFSKPVKTRFGYHVIKMDGRKEAGTTMTFDEVKDSIRQNLSMERMNQVVDQLLSKYKIEYLGDYGDKPADENGDGKDKDGAGTDGQKDDENKDGAKDDAGKDAGADQGEGSGGE